MIRRLLDAYAEHHSPPLPHAQLNLTVTIYIYGIALWLPMRLGGLAIVGGVPTTVAGVVMAYTGFSEVAMAINMPAGAILLIWMFTLGVLMWRRGGVPSTETAV